MKLLAVIFCLVFSVRALGQGNDEPHVDTSKKFIIRDFYYNQNEKILYVINNKSTYTKPSESMFPDTSDILEAHVLKGKQASDKYGKQAQNGVIIITTKTYAVQQYQKKFCALSKEYSKHLDKGNDKDINFFVNKAFLEGSYNEKIRQLYDILPQVRAVTLVENQYYNGPPSEPFIAIVVTKK